jgi:hypothetical protein
MAYLARLSLDTEDVKRLLAKQLQIEYSINISLDQIELAHDNVKLANNTKNSAIFEIALDFETNDTPRVLRGLSSPD